MVFSLKHISRKINKSLSETYELAKGLDSSLSEVTFRYWNRTTNTYACRVISVERLEETDKLYKVIILHNGKNTQIITGANNVKKNSIIPVALVGAVLTGSDSKKLEIGKRNLAGYESNGMLLSEKELGVGDDHTGIYQLKGIDEGTNLSELLNDILMEFENVAFSNRPDLFSYESIVREIIASNYLKDIDLKHETIFDNYKENDSIQPPVIKILDDCSEVKAFSAVSVENFVIEESYTIIKDLLYKSDVTSINNIVDLTNIALLETGFPIHAFSLDYTGNMVSIGKVADDNISITLLDGKTRKISKQNDIVIQNSNTNEPLDYAGIMGGYNSRITSETKRILLVSNLVNGAVIRKTSRNIQARTDASNIFEKSPTYANSRKSINFFLNSLCTIFEDTKASKMSEVINSSEIDETYRIPFNSKEELFHIIGKDISRYIDVDRVLSLLGIEPIKDKGNIYLVPPKTRKDIKYINDVAEEVLRIYGLDRLLNENIIEFPRGNNYSLKKNIKRVLREFLYANGFFEVEGYVLDNSSFYEKFHVSDTIKVINPISANYTVLKRDLVTDIFETAKKNYGFFNDYFVFEINKTFYTSDKDKDKYIENNILSGAYISKRSKGDIEESEKESYFKLKEIFDRLLNNFKYTNIASISNKKSNGTIKVGVEYFNGNDLIASIYIPSSECFNFFDFKDNISYFEIYIDKLSIDDGMTSLTDKLRSRFPEIRRNISFFIDREHLFNDIKNAINSLHIKYLQNIKVVENITIENKNSILLEITFQSIEKTLQEKDVDKEIKKIEDQLIKRFGVVIR